MPANSVGKAVIEIGADASSLDSDAKSAAKSAFAKVEAEAKSSGKAAGKKLADGVGAGADDIPQEVEPPAKEGAEEVVEQFEKVGDALSTAVSGPIIAGLALVGGTAAFGALIGDAAEAEGSVAKVSASLGLNAAEQEKVAAAAEQVFGNAYADSVDEAAAAVEALLGSVEGMRDASASEIGDMTSDLQTLANVMDLDVAGAAQTVGAMMKTGMAADAEEALDLLAGGLQEVNTSLRGEAVDSINEYSTYFKQLGIDGPAAMGLLADASDISQYAMDKAGDALKELTIRATDGSDASTLAFEAIGLDAEKMATAIASGGDKANSAFTDIVDGLLGIKDPAVQGQTAIALFGTPLEDIGTDQIPAFLDALASGGGGMDDFAGKMDEVDQVANDTFGVQWQTLVNSVQMMAQDAIEPLLPYLSDLVSWLSQVAQGDAARTMFEAFKDAAATLGDVLINTVIPALVDTVAWIVENQDVLTAVAVALGVGITVWGAFAVAVNAVTIATNAAKVAQAAWNVVMLANPLGLIVAAIAAVVAGLVWFFTQTEVGREAWQTFTDWLVTAWEWIKETAVAIWEGLADFFTGLWASISDTASAVWDAIKAVITGHIKAVRTVIRTVLRAISSLWSNIWTGIQTAVELVWTGIKWYVTTYIKVIRTVIRTVVTGIKTLWANTWGAIRDKAVDIWTTIRDFVTEKIRAVRETIKSITDAIKRVWSNAWGAIKDTVTDKIADVMAKVRGFKDKITGVFSNAKEWLTNAGKAILDGLWNGLKSKWSEVSGWVGDLGGKIADLKGPYDYDLRLLTRNGEALMQGLQTGIQAGFPAVEDELRSITASISPTVGALATPSALTMPAVASSAPATSSSVVGDTNISITVPLDDLAQMRDLEDFLDLVRARARQGVERSVT